VILNKEADRTIWYSLIEMYESMGESENVLSAIE